MIKKQSCLMAMCIPLLIVAQDSANKGIKWTTGLSWEQVKQKAKQENKYIFLDCFTTWCGPCKQMDNSTYVNDSVGVFFNDEFISIKVQMDKTKKDNDEIKSWYNNSDSIANEYHVEGYPTFIFLSPQGEVVEKQMGFKTAGDFLAIGKGALVPGKKYDDVYARYNILTAAYALGQKDYNQYPFMIKMADKLDEQDFCHELIKELSDYVYSLPRNKRYTKDRIEMWAAFSWASTTKVFSFFKKDGKLIDKVMNQKGYSTAIVDKTIQAEMAVPFMEEQAKGSEIAVIGAYLSGPGLKTDYREANWKKLDATIRKKYGKAYAKRNVLTARVEWYSRHQNNLAFVNYALKKLNKYPPDTSKDSYYRINYFAWPAFIYSTDKKVLNGYTQWMTKVIAKVPGYSELMDTYAQLLYKTGRKNKAIDWEQKAYVLAPKDKNIQQSLERMRKGYPTYVEQGAEWDRVSSVNWEGFRFQKWFLILGPDRKEVNGVIVKNKSSGELKSSDEKGTVSMEVSLDDTVTISYRGYKTQEITIKKGPGIISIVMIPN